MSGLDSGGGMNDDKLHFVDVETFGLDADRHAIFEISTCGLLKDTPHHTFFLQPSAQELSAADAQALQITGYYERLIKYQPTHESTMQEFLDPSDVHALDRFDQALASPPTPGQVIWVPSAKRGILAVYLAWKWSGHLAGNSVNFDAMRLEKWLRVHGAAPQWHYHLVDVEAYAAGALGQLPNWKSADLSQALNVDPPVEKRHTAATDVQWSRDMFIAAAQLNATLPEGII